MSTITFQNQSESDLLKSLKKIIATLPKKYTLHLTIDPTSDTEQPSHTEIDKMISESITENNSIDGPFDNVEDLMKSLNQ